jgi:hypothetical protein
MKLGFRVQGFRLLDYTGRAGIQLMFTESGCVQLAKTDPKYSAARKTSRMASSVIRGIKSNIQYVQYICNQTIVSSS